MGWLFPNKKRREDNRVIQSPIDGILMPPTLEEKQMPKVPKPTSSPVSVEFPSMEEDENLEIPELDLPSDFQVPDDSKTYNYNQNQKKEQPLEMVIDIEEPITYPAIQKEITKPIQQKDERINIPSKQIITKEKVIAQENDRYLSIEQFSDIKEAINDSRDMLKECETTAERLNIIKNKEDSNISAWKASLEIVERKLSYMEETLFR